MNWKVGAVPLLLFFISSVLLMLPERTTSPYVRSSELEIVQTDGEDTIRYDYMDKTGKITFASDKGYATLLKTTRNGQVIFEQYQDEKGRPARQKAGYCSIAREYDEKGHNTVIHYLNEDQNPVSISSGYATILKTYYENNLADTDTYLDIHGNPTAARSGYSGYKREYDEKKRISRLIYLDAEGHPFQIKAGYAQIIRTYYETEETLSKKTDKIRTEMYLDASGSPAVLSIGHSGEYREYDENGKNFRTTYLDAEGHPVNTLRGYATVQRTYDSDGNIRDEMYFDQEGHPAALSKGQYGIRHEKGKTLYLDENGDAVFSLSGFLYNYPVSVPVLGIMAVALILLTPRKTRWMCFLGYILFILYMTIMYREKGDVQLNLEPFWSYRAAAEDTSMRLDILNNIWLFVPFGAATMRLLSEKKHKAWISVFFCAAFSLAIEAIQYFSGLGLCELDDIFNNTMGGAIGTFIAFSFQRWEFLLSEKS